MSRARVRYRCRYRRRVFDNGNGNGLGLGAFAGAGDTVQMRFSFGVDGCNGVDGWYLDRVLIVIEGDGPRRPDGRAATRVSPP